MTLLLSRTELESLVDTEAIMGAVEAALRGVAIGTATQPAPALVEAGADRFLVMSATDAVSELASAKWLADFPLNREHGLPAQQSLILLSSSTTGEPLAILDGRVPTRERTASTTAIATRALSRSDSSIVGFIGAGKLAEPHLRAIRHVRDVRRVVIWSRSRDTAAAFASAARAPGLEIAIADSPEHVARASDIVCTLTPSHDPILLGEWLRPGTHVNAVGAPPRPDYREIDSATAARAQLFVDHLETALHESGDVLIPLSEGAIRQSDLLATLGEVLAGTHPGRTDDDAITVFDSVGTGIQDLAVAGFFVNAAQAAGKGTDFPFTA